MKTLTLAMITFLSSQVAMAGDVQHVGSKVLTKDQYISALKPKPKYKTRGIRFNNQPEPEQQALALNVNFEYNSAELTQDALAQLNPLGHALNSEELAPYSFVIDGHTDALGTEEYNLELSQQRALSVGNYLYANFGVDAARLVLNGKGEYELYDTDQPESALNRRVQITTVATPTE